MYCTSVQLYLAGDRDFLHRFSKVGQLCESCVTGVSSPDHLNTQYIRTQQHVKEAQIQRCPHHSTNVKLCTAYMYM